MSQLSADCLYDIFEYLADDKFTLHSCILVNRLWCEVSVKISWKNVQNYSTSNFKTLIACLPSKSKEILYNNGIIIPTPTSKFPTFNYASFCKVIIASQVYRKLALLLKNKHLISSQDLKISTNIVAQEIFKLFVTQISSLEKLAISTFYQFRSCQTPSTYFISCPEAKNCLKSLSELRCSSNVSSESFHILSQICHYLTHLDITIEGYISNELVDLISAQGSLRYFNLNILGDDDGDDSEINLLITKIPNTLIGLSLCGDKYCHISLLFVANFTDLQELKLEFPDSGNFVGFEILQYTIFPQLQILNFVNAHPRCELLIKFLENNGKNLKELHSCAIDPINLAIAKFCPNIRKLFTGIENDKLETLKIIIDNCQYIESIKVQCGDLLLNEKDLLEVIVKYSKSIHEIILYYQFELTQFGILPKELESFFISWENLIPQRSLSLVIVTSDNYDNDNKSLDKNDENMKIIEKYIKLGVIKKFKLTSFDDDEFNDKYSLIKGLLI